MGELSDNEFREQTLERDENECQYCGSKGSAVNGLEAHHITHEKDGGTTELDNGITLCKEHHDVVHGLVESGEDPVEVLTKYGVPKDIPEIRGINGCKSVMVLDVLKEGRANPKWIKEKTGLNDQQVNYALNQLIAAGWVEKLTKGLYELRGDPRDD